MIMFYCCPNREPVSNLRGISQPVLDHAALPLAALSGPARRKPGLTTIRCSDGRCGSDDDDDDDGGGGGEDDDDDITIAAAVSSSRCCY